MPAEPLVSARELYPLAYWFRRYQRDLRVGRAPVTSAHANQRWELRIHDVYLFFAPAGIECPPAYVKWWVSSVADVAGMYLSARVLRPRPGGLVHGPTTTIEYQEDQACDLAGFLTTVCKSSVRLLQQAPPLAQDAPRVRYGR